ncbi:MAG TPA: S8 family serine peptidase [Pseudonocardiaceae bacterium]|nr:S8 family serine peptidase [Pseudonocardiaceae bacterium]
MSGRRHLRVVLATTTAALLATALSNAPATAAPQQGNGKSEAVIVLMRAQHPDLKPKTDAKQRQQAVSADQAGVVADLRSHGATHVQQLNTVSAVAATATQSEISRLEANPQIASVVPDRMIPLPATAGTNARPTDQPGGRAQCTSDPSKPQLEPEALSLTNTENPNPSVPQAHDIATGKGVKIAFMADGIDIDNPDYIRPDGTPVFADYQDFSGDGKNDASGGAEAFGDASSLAAQGNTVFDLSTALPNAGLPAGCTFRIKGFAPGASLVGIKVFGQFGAPESAFVRGIDYAVNVDKVDVINQSFGGFDFPDGAADPVAIADEAAIAAGVTVVASSGDSGTSGTVGTPASAPDVIAAAGTTSYRLNAQDKGYPTFVSNNISGLSSGGPTLDNKYVDIVAPSVSGMADCTVGDPWPECTQNSQAFGGTSQASPFVAGAAALVIQAYADSHHGARPTPALVKHLLLGTATDINAPSDQQGAGLLNSLAAVQAAQAVGNTRDSDSNALVPSHTQLDLTGAAGSTQHASETVTNESDHPQTVTASSREVGPRTFSFNKTVQITGATPPPANPPGGPGESPQAAPSFTFNVAKNTQWMTAEMAWPGTATSGQLAFELFDPKGDLVEESYDFGFTDFQHVGIHDPAAGAWTEKILWDNGRDHFQEALDAPGTFRGGVMVQIVGSKYRSAGVNKVTKTIPAGGSATFKLNVPMPNQAGDAPASIQLDSDRGTHESIPLARRVLIPTGAGSFTATLTGGVGRGLNQYKAWYLDVPAGEKDMTVNLTGIDPATQVIFLLSSPDGQILSGDENAVEDAWNTFSGNTTDTSSMVVDKPAKGRWQLMALLASPSSGTEFSQSFHGTVRFNTVKASATGLPNSAARKVSAAHPATASVTVKNTSAAGAFFFLDPRLNAETDVTLPPVAGDSTIDLPEDQADTSPPIYNVPTHVSTLSQTFNSTVPADDYLEFGDGNPGPYLFSGTGSVNSITADQLAFGTWFTDVGEVGPFPTTAPAGTATLSLSAHMQPFDSDVTSSTGDFWLTALNGSAGNAVFIPAGGTATIPLTITPTAAAGTVVHGTVYVDTWNNFAGQGSELAGIPYSYTAG